MKAESTKVLANPALKERLEKSGLELWPVPADELVNVVREDHARWAKVVREANIKAE